VVDPVEIKRLLEAYEIAMVETYAAADAEQPLVHASAIFAQGATVVLKIMSRDNCSQVDVRGVVLTSPPPMPCVQRQPTSWRGRRRVARRPDSGVIVQAIDGAERRAKLILGLADDPTLAPVGCVRPRRHGGRDSSRQGVALPPLDLPMARDLIDAPASRGCLRAYRDVPAVKPDAVALVWSSWAAVGRGISPNPEAGHQSVAGG